MCVFPPFLGRRRRQDVELFTIAGEVLDFLFTIAVFLIKYRTLTIFLDNSRTSLFTLHSFPSQLALINYKHINISCESCNIVVSRYVYNSSNIIHWHIFWDRNVWHLGVRISSKDDQKSIKECIKSYEKSWWNRLSIYEDENEQWVHFMKYNIIFDRRL